MARAYKPEYAPGSDNTDHRIPNRVRTSDRWKHSGQLSLPHFGLLLAFAPKIHHKVPVHSIRPFASEMLAPPEGLAQFRWPQAWENGPLAQAPFDVEIGCGVGWHPIQYAKAHPDRRLLAIEHTRAKFERFQNRIDHHPQLMNLLGIHADAIRWITHGLKPSTVSRAIFMYPNPEPKASNKRWFRSPFMHRLLEVLNTNGEIWLATNEEWYWQEALDYAQKAWSLEVVEARRFNLATAPPESPRTHFEKKYLQRGETCFDLRLRKP